MGLCHCYKSPIVHPLLQSRDRLENVVTSTTSLSDTKMLKEYIEQQNRRKLSSEQIDQYLDDNNVQQTALIQSLTANVDSLNKTIDSLTVDKTRLQREIETLKSSLAATKKKVKAAEK